MVTSGIVLIVTVALCVVRPIAPLSAIQIENKKEISGNGLHIIGNDNVVTGDNNSLTGNNNTGIGNNIAFQGNDARAIGDNSNIAGNFGDVNGTIGTRINGNFAKAIINKAFVNGNSAFIKGNSATSNGNNAIIVGDDAKVEGYKPVVTGNNAYICSNIGNHIVVQGNDIWIETKNNANGEVLNQVEVQGKNATVSSQCGQMYDDNVDLYDVTITGEMLIVEVNGQLVQGENETIDNNIISISKD